MCELIQQFYSQLSTVRICPQSTRPHTTTPYIYGTLAAYSPSASHVQARCSCAHYCQYSSQASASQTVVREFSIHTGDWSLAEQQQQYLLACILFFFSSVRRVDRAHQIEATLTDTLPRGRLALLNSLTDDCLSTSFLHATFRAIVNAHYPLLLPRLLSLLLPVTVVAAAAASLRIFSCLHERLPASSHLSCRRYR